MSKKKKGTPTDGDDMMEIEKMLLEIMERNGITKEDMIATYQQMSERGEGDMMTKMYYSYTKPDYSKHLHELHPALDLLMVIREPMGLVWACRGAQKRLVDEGADVGAELKNALYWILAYQNTFYLQGKSNLPLFCILCLMMEMQVTDATDELLELLRQDGKFFEFFFEAFEQDMSMVMSRLCINDLDKLEKFMYETGRIPSSKCITADAVIHIAVTNPSHRLRVMGWFTKVLKRYSEIKVVETNIDHIVHSLGRLRPKELQSLILQLYKKKDIPFIEVEDMDHVNQLIEKGTDEPMVEYDSMFDLFEILERHYEESEDALFDDDDDDDDDGDDGESLLVAEQYDGKLFRLEVTLDNSPIEVRREIIVPSNIRLSHFAEILVIAMGWEGYHLNQFVKKDIYYCSSEELEESCGCTENQEPFEEYTLGELLIRRGSNIKWEYDFGDCWMHTIRLVEKLDDLNRKPIELTKAIGACPPEDCGGVWGYAEMLDILKDKTHPEYKEYEEWLQPGFSPTKVDAKSIRRKLAGYYNDNK